MTTQPRSAPPLNEIQQDMLRHLARQTGPVPEEHLDGRVLRVLRARCLVQETAGWVRINDVGRTALGQARNAPERPRRSRGHGDAAAQGRAAVILRAVEQLEAAIPRDAEVEVGSTPAYADDVLEGLRRYARRLTRGDATRD